MINVDLKNLWLQRITEQRDSGKSIAAWCKEQSLKENQFYYWNKKIGNNPICKKQQVEWLSVKVDPVTITPNSIKVNIGPASVDIEKDFDQQLFRQIAQVLLSL